MQFAATRRETVSGESPDTTPESGVLPGQYDANFRVSVLRAFTLLEVLTALGVFCFAVLGLLFALNTAADAAREAQEQKRIRAQVENRLARLSLPPLKEFAAREEAEGVRFSEEIRQEPVKTADLSLLPGYWRVRVLAEWKDGGRPQQWDVSHLVWNP